jgi:hypothetical protein
MTLFGSFRLYTRRHILQYCQLHFEQKKQRYKKQEAFSW